MVQHLKLLLTITALHPPLLFSLWFLFMDANWKLECAGSWPKLMPMLISHPVNHPNRLGQRPSLHSSRCLPLTEWAPTRCQAPAISAPAFKRAHNLTVRMAVIHFEQLAFMHIVPVMTHLKLQIVSCVLCKHLLVVTSLLCYVITSKWPHIVFVSSVVLRLQFGCL